MGDEGGEPGRAALSAAALTSADQEALRSLVAVSVIMRSLRLVFEDGVTSVEATEVEWPLAEDTRTDAVNDK